MVYLTRSQYKQIFFNFDIDVTPSQSSNYKYVYNFGILGSTIPVSMYKFPKVAETKCFMVMKIIICT